MNDGSLFVEPSAYHPRHLPASVLLSDEPHSMSISSLPLSYCTNVHPGMSVGEVVDGLTKYTAAAQQQMVAPIAAGLWLAQPVIDELLSNEKQVAQLQQGLRSNELACYTLNAFPYGNFHSERVKEQVYVPDWTTDDRLQYTIGCAQILAQLMPVGVEGSISTVPLGFKQMPRDDDFEQRCCDQLITLAESLDGLHDDSGRVIRLAIEPEPLCVLETTEETLQFF